MLDIFVFTQSGWLRKLEVRCPGERRHGKEERRMCDGWWIGYPGIWAMDTHDQVWFGKWFWGSMSEKY